MTSPQSDPTSGNAPAASRDDKVVHMERAELGPSAAGQRVGEVATGDGSSSSGARGPGGGSIAMRAFRALLQIAIVAGVLFGAYTGFTWLRDSKPEVAKRPKREKVFTVSVMPAQFATHTPALTLFGTAVAGRQVEIRALVAGQVVATSNKLREGGQVARGDPLITIDPFDYRGALTDAEAQLAEARARIREIEAQIAQDKTLLTFAQEQLALSLTDLDRARRLTQRGSASKQTLDNRLLTVSQRRQSVEQLTSGIKVKEARADQQRASLKRLEWGLTRARQRLADTQLKAPFNAYVSQVGAQVGRMLNVNDRVATLIDREWIEVRFVLSDRQYGRIVAAEGKLTGRTVRVLWKIGDNPLQYDGVVDRTAAQISAQNGGVEVYARIASPLKPAPLRPGAFVEVQIADITYPKAVKLPQAAIYNGTIIYVVQKDRLVERKVTVIARAGEDVLVRGEIAEGDRVVRSRLSAPGPGLKVRERVAK